MSRALNTLGQIKSLDISVITRSWEDNSNSEYKIITCNPKMAGRTERERAFAKEAQKYFSQFDLVQSHERILGCHIYRAGDGVHREWLNQRARVLNPVKKRLLWCSPFHRYIMQQEQKMYADSGLKAIICNSKMVAEEIKYYFGVPAEKIHLINNGVDTERFTPALKSEFRSAVRQQLGISEDAATMLFIGSGFERKGLLGALHAISLPSDTKTHLIVVGKDKRQSIYQKAVNRLNLGKRVHFVGVQSDPRPYYGAADMLLLPTLYDPFPNVILEAMASGLAVITSTKCGGKELVRSGENGFICDALDYKMLQFFVAQAKSIGFIQLGENARRTAEPYNHTFLGQNMFRLYQ